MIPVLATWDICSKRERDWGRSPFMFLAIHTSRRWGEGLLHDCVFPGLRTHIPSGMPLQGREEHESLREPCDQIEELFRDLRRKLSRRLARYYLAIALFPSPLSERS